MSGANFILSLSRQNVFILVLSLSRLHKQSNRRYCFMSVCSYARNFFLCKAKCVEPSILTKNHVATLCRCRYFVTILWQFNRDSFNYNRCRQLPKSATIFKTCPSWLHDSIGNSVCLGRALTQWRNFRISFWSGLFWEVLELGPKSFWGAILKIFEKLSRKYDFIGRFPGSANALTVSFFFLL